MTVTVCSTCGGEYQGAQRDGTRYFHVCPDSFPPQARRDENPASTREVDRDKIKSEGNGTAEARR